MTQAALPAEPAQLLELYRSMVRIRTFEDTVQKLYEKALVHGSTHLCQGQEAVAVGWAAALTPEDYTSYTDRGHGHALARGMSPEAAFAEILGRSTGVNRGTGGSMHLTDARLGLMGCFAIVGSGLPVAVGLGRGAQLRREPRVSVTFFGDGASNIGAFHEALNLAAIWKAPVIFVCENNLYGEYSRINLTTTVEDIAVRATAHALPSQIVDGNDVQAAYQAAQVVVDRARTGGGPSQWRRVAGMAALAGVRMAHHEEPQISAQLLASVSHGTLVEGFLPDCDPIFWNLIANRPALEDGAYPVPTGPGWGLELDPAFVERYRAA